jgi:glycosyltransferase involved in cell wall biosynthesis
MTKRPRVAIVVNGGVFSGHQSEGLPVMTKLVSGLSKNHELVVYSFTEIDTDLAPFKAVPIHGTKFNKYFQFFRAIIKDHREHPFSLIHGFFGLPSGVLSVLLSKWLRIPSVVTLMGGESANLPDSNFGALRKWHTRRLVFWMISKASRVVAQTEYQRKILRENGLDGKLDMEVIPFGIERSVSESKPFQSLPYQLISVGNINLIKDHFTLIRALVELRKTLDVKLKIVGGDFLNGLIQSFVKEQGVENSVDFVGQKNNQEAIEELRQSHILVISSKSEGMSVVFLEAMMNGVSVCSTRVGLMHDLADSHCLVSEAKDHIKLAENIQKVLTDDELRKQLINNGREWVLQNDLDTTIARYGQVYALF